MTLFKKTEESERPASPPTQALKQTQQVKPKGRSVIGPTLVFKGDLSADEDLIIEGVIEGTISHQTKHLTVGERGRIKADIHAKTVLVLGQVVGDIHCKGMVSLAKTANVKGNISCGRIVMEDGARLEGKLDMSEPKKAKVVPKEAANEDPGRSKKPQAAAG